MCEHDEVLQRLQGILDTLNGDKYEDLGVWTVGGANGVYSLKSPANTEAEFALFGISATSACQVLVSQNQQSNNLAINGAVSYGTGGGNENNALEGMFLTIPAATSGAPTSFDYWQPIGRGSSIYVLISGLSSNACFVMFAFRRLLLREIPAPPRRPPITHTTRQSARYQRTLPAMSPEVVGAMEQRTVLPGGPQYNHVHSPGEDHDIAAINRGIAQPLTPAQVVLAKLRGKTGVY